MKKLIPVLGYLAVVAALIFGVGLLRPREQAARVVAVIRIEPEQVWRTLHDAAHWHEWLPGVDRMRGMAERDGNPVWKGSGAWGEFEIELTGVREPYEMTVLINGDKFLGRWVLDIEPVPAGTALTITETGEVENPFFRGLMLFANRHAEMLETVESLAALHEAGISTQELDVEPGG